MTMAMELIRHIAGLYSGKAFRGDFTQVYITGNEIWMAQQILASQHTEQAEDAQEEPLPYWEPCNPACDPELNGFRDRKCNCAQARAALAQPSPAPKSGMQRAIESWEELSLGAHLYRCCVGVWNNLLPEEEAMPEYRELRKAMDDWENGKPSPAPELEQVERFEPAHGTDRGGNVFAYMIDNEAGEYMEFAQHDRIIGALRAEIDEVDGLSKRLDDLLHQTAIALRGTEPALTRYGYADLPLRVKTLLEERDVDLAKLAAMEQQEPVEEWRPVVGFDGHYSVSSLGRLRSDKTGKYLSLNSLMASGYVKASLHRDGVREQTSVHRVVAKAFLDNPEGLDEVNHLNGDKTDNRVINLAWCSRSENVDHGYYQLGHLVHPVKAIPAEGNGPVLIFSSIEQAVANGFTSRNIYDCLVEGYRVHAGHHWQSMRSDQVAQAGQVPEGYLLITQDQVERHATTAWECPPQSRVVLVSTLKRLHEKNVAAPQQAGGE